MTVIDIAPPTESAPEGPAPTEPAPGSDEAVRLCLAEIGELVARRGCRLSAEIELIEGAVFRARPVLRRA